MLVSRILKVKSVIQQEETIQKRNVIDYAQNQLYLLVVFSWVYLSIVLNI